MGQKKGVHNVYTVACDTGLAANRRVANVAV